MVSFSRSLALVLFQSIPLILLFLVFINPVYAIQPKFHRLSTHEKSASVSAIPSTASNNLKTYYYKQTLDHFNYGPESYAKFNQRYFVDSTYWGGSNMSAPIFAYLGAESPVEEDIPYIGFLTDNAPIFNSLLVYIEHRFYGKSIPYGSMNDAMGNKTLRGYFNSAQALADYAEVLLHIKKKFSAHHSPIIVVGGSYGGMLASWFRLKYPHIAVGALASSAPILYFDNITPQDGYYTTITRDFKDAGESCYQTIKKSWSLIDRMASTPNGLAKLSRKFKTCAPLNSSSDLKNYLDSMYTVAAQYNQPPRYPVTSICNGIDGAPKKTDTLGRIFAGVVSYLREMPCYNMNGYSSVSETDLGWGWQTCSEMVMPVGRKEDMFPASPFNYAEFADYCQSIYGVPPRPHWITTYYGGHDIKLVLERFGSNIIFSNGLADPYSSAGVLEDISESVLALKTAKGSHCLDLHGSRDTDPDWLVMQRKTAVEIIQGWIGEYHHNLQALKRRLR